MFGIFQIVAMTVPEEFHVQLTSATSRPDPSPPRHNKKHIYKDVDPRAILKIDEHALAVRISNVQACKCLLFIYTMTKKRF